MNYREQLGYLQRSRLWAITLALVWLGTSTISFALVRISVRSAVAFGCIVIAIAVSLLYTPDYIHLTVNPRKKIRWQIMIRWRILGIALALGLASCLSARPLNLMDTVFLISAIAWLAGANLVARKRQTWSGLAAYFWAGDCAVLTVSLLLGHCHALVIAALLAMAAHLSILLCDRHWMAWPVTVAAGSWIALLFARVKPESDQNLALGAIMVLISAGATAWLIHRAQQHNARNVQGALQELMEFTGYPAERIRHLWSESDKELAQNWVAAVLDESDSRVLADWYRQNSELYMFAISGYNLDYKRIRSNLKVLGFARGACLDYGAGNGEIILELARQGHPATYYDVDGVSARFARHRALSQGLDVKFAHDKAELATAVQNNGFDTVFSLDVLEHLPDLAGELTFLAGLINPSGRFVFDIPAGSTKSHPMHLNHNVEFRSLLNHKGLRESCRWWQRLPFRKQEKYVFVAG